MKQNYRVTRKLQEQSGSYFVTLPKIWVIAWNMEEGDEISIEFNDVLKVIPPDYQEEQRE